MEEVKEALSILFGNNRNISQQGRTQAHEWLLKWKEENNAEGWTICFNLISCSTLPPSAHLFATVCLQHKIVENYHWKTLPKGFNFELSFN